ncbi:MAG: uL22 family ribosomal protein, partial [Candidatus Phytoplasma australasiaticum]|nr:uL22 family ribosomal protein [Candidatus Phytoplasma australasiaticum]
MINNDVKAIVKRVPIAPRKIRLVIDLIRDKSIEEAQAILDFTNKA